MQRLRVSTSRFLEWGRDNEVEERGIVVLVAPVALIFLWILT